MENGYYKEGAMITCPACSGHGGGNGFMCGRGPGGHRFGWIPCSFCNGAKEVTEETAKRYEQGKAMARERRERRVASREEARRLGVDWGEWTRIEYGREPETPEGHAAWEKRLKEMKQMDEKEKPIERTAVKSTNVKSVGYCPDRKCIEIEFSGGGVYRYHDCDQALFDELMKAESVGKFVDVNLKKSKKKFTKL